jgi:sugar phosphate isomerase/epimerase
MRFGCCVGLELLDTAAEVGYDFVELPSSLLLPEDPETCFGPLREQVAAASIGAEVWELCLPSDLEVCGPAVDWPRVSRYVNTVFRRIAAIGGTMVGFPCGECCDVPAGTSTADALGQLCDFLRVCGAMARSRGLVIGLEAFPRGRPHLVNSTPEAMELARRMNTPEIGVLANGSQVVRADQSLLDIADAGAWLAHVHVSATDLEADSDPGGRMQELSRALRLADYSGRIAVQGDWSSPREEMKRALAALRHWFQDNQEEWNA